MKPSEFARGGRYAVDFEGLPLLVARGARPGKTLVVSAGVHGDEYEGIRAILELYQELDPGQMSGDLLAVPVANPPAFWNGSRTSPLDGGNLARVFPGRRDGSPTEMLAYHFDRDVLPHADLYVDLHSAGIRCLMPVLAGYDATDPRSRDAAFLFGAKIVWGHPNTPPGRTISAAKARHIPAIYAEARGGGRIDPGDLQLYRNGVRNLLQHLRILPGEPATARCEYHLYGDGDIDQSVTCTQRGFLIPQVELLQPVRKGDEIGRLLDLHGNTIERYSSPSNGVVVLIHACPLVEPGEPLFLVTGVHAE